MLGVTVSSVLLSREGLTNLVRRGHHLFDASFRRAVEVNGSLTRVLVEQIGAVDPSRLGESHGLLARDELRDVDRALAIVLGLGR
jgi:mRNA-degrading endonuclease toxin of MazEF toxin-antitoxin module